MTFTTRTRGAGLLLALMTLAAPAMAGGLDAPGAPAAGSGMPSTADIYNRLNSGAAVSVPGTFQEPATGPTAGTGKTLSEIAAKLPAPDNTNGAAAADVINGKTFWGLRTDGTWGPRTGTQVVPATGTNVTGGNGALSFAIPDALYTGRTATAADGNLQPGNIKSGVSIFGVTGTSAQASGTAAAGDVLTGKTFSNGSATGISGTMPSGSNITGSNGTLSITVPAAYYSGSTTATASDSNLVSGNVKSGVSVFGVSGAPSVVDTATATAAATDIATGKTAFVNGVLITGTSTSSSSHVACEQGWGGANCATACPNGFSGTNCDILYKPFGGTVPTYSSTPWNCVRDAGTGLTWEVKTTDGALRDWGWTYTWDSPGNSCGGTLAHCDTQDYVAAVNAASLCGYTDWRMPSKDELLGLVVGSTPGPTIDTAYFPNTKAWDFWSGSSDVQDPIFAWEVYFYDGFTYADFKTYGYYVRLVRGGQ